MQTAALEDKLKEYFGFNTFRPNQREIVESVLNHRDVLAILPTGAGKSLTYQFPAMIMPGIAIVVSPLISLMQDQVVSLNKSGIPAAFLNSSLPMSEMMNVMYQLHDYKLLFVAPERFGDQRFIDRLKEHSVSFFAVDEAHCISQWGHSFRPEYRQLTFLKQTFPNTSILALTATATLDVEKDITQQLAMKDPFLVKSSFDRTNLTIRVAQKSDPYTQMRTFLEKKPDQSGIIYCGTRKKVDETYDQLKSEGYEICKYHAGMSDSMRARSQHAFIYDEVKLIVATVAFGMGIHKPDIRFIVHMDMPKSIEQYYQEIGRAGRDGLPSECLMLYGYDDIQLYQFFINKMDNLEERKITSNKLEQMSKLCRSYRCRRKSFLEYFGEKYTKDNCQNCDNCLDDVDMIDGTEIAKKILSCVYRMHQNYGAAMVVDVLRGSKSQKVLSKGLNRLSTYNLMREYSDKELRYYINCLIDMGYLQRTTGEYPILKWTEKTPELVFGDKEIQFRKKFEKKVQKKVSDVPDYDRSLFEKLRDLRTTVAHEMEVPPYAVFQDRSLMEMAVYYPQEKEQMLLVNGVGQQKWQLYGEQFIGLIKQYCELNGIQSKLRPVPQSKPVKVERPPSTPKVSTYNQTLALWKQGLTTEQIAAERGIAERTIYEHLEQLIEAGEDIELDKLVETEVQELIQGVIDEVGPELLKPIKEKLPEEISYDEIRLVRALYT